MAEARRYVWDLRSQSLDDRDLPAALAEMTRRLTAESGVHTQFEVGGTLRPLPKQVENNLLRIAQEAVNNAVRHARAENISCASSSTRRACALTSKTTGAASTPKREAARLERALRARRHARARA